LTKERKMDKTKEGKKNERKGKEVDKQNVLA